MRVARNIILTSLVVFMVSVPCLAQNMMDMVNNLDLTRINSMQIVSESNRYFLKFNIGIENKNESGIQLRNGVFDITIRRGDVQTTLGQTKAEDLIIEAKGEDFLKLMADMGPVSLETCDRLFYVFNIVNASGSNLEMDLIGDSEVGLQVKKGWFFEKGRAFHVELLFRPSYQREHTID